MSGYNYTVAPGLSYSSRYSGGEVMGAVIAQLLIVLMKEGLEMAQIQRDLAAGRITEDQARTRLRATQDKYAATRRAWDQAG